MSIIVAKIGSSSITDDRGVIDKAMIVALCEQVVRLRQLGHQVVLVSSGAVSAGVSAMRFAQRPSDMATLQAISAIGQARLMQTYDAALSEADLVPAQVLLTSHEFTNRRQYLHARQTLLRLLELGAVPIINENDAITNDELRYGDNDRIAALVAHLISADLLVLLTDIEGLYTADPRTDPSASLVSDVSADDPVLHVQAGASGSNRGSGGMASKLAAARIASWSGVTAVIARADRADVLIEAVAGQPVGTRFAAHDRRLSARKLWIGFASGSSGRIVVDDGARSALVERGTSLLPAGIVGVEGSFDEYDTVEVASTDGKVFARGLVTMSSARLLGAMGRRSADLDPETPREAVHRDDLVLVLS